ncbi:heterokaryon incompatibility protein-domain-containing protein [Xylariales sp. PMI_506]|nr:heterokaryon incompatibility protein-domain-containing protein [Xylariales sp. PMI_506]
MRLIDTSTGHLAEFSSSPPRYAILSHTWDIEEITFQDLCSQNPCNSKKGYDKLKNFIELAKKSRHQYVWADTCCIDKTSSAELSEAINSMFQWYRKATVCFVYLSDVSTRSQGRSRNERTTWTDAVLLEKLSNSRWFRRSWTLQELIAPVSVEFYSQEWDYVGTKIDLCRFLNRITRISNGVLVEINGYKQASVAQKMSWAAEREATREEDVSYSLFGIFDVNMAPLYGEGHERAFRRLQEEIIRTCTDETILIWSMPFGNSEICRPSRGISENFSWNPLYLLSSSRSRSQ